MRTDCFAEVSALHTFGACNQKDMACLRWSKRVICPVKFAQPVDGLLTGDANGRKCGKRFGIVLIGAGAKGISGGDSCGFMKVYAAGVTCAAHKTVVNAPRAVCERWASIVFYAGARGQPLALRKCT